MTNTEFEILTILMQEPETAISKQKLYVAVQGVYIGDDNTISVHVSNIRKRLIYIRMTYIFKQFGVLIYVSLNLYDFFIFCLRVFKKILVTV